MAIDDFRLNLEKLWKLYPVKTICMHGSPLSKWDNRDLWMKYDYLLAKAGSARNPIKNKEMIEPPARRLAQGAKIPKEDTQGLKQFSFAGKRQKKRQPCPKTLPGFGQYITSPFTLGVLGGSKFSCFF